MKEWDGPKPLTIVLFSLLQLYILLEKIWLRKTGTYDLRGTKAAMASHLASSGIHESQETIALYQDKYNLAMQQQIVEDLAMTTILVFDADHGLYSVQSADA